MALHKNFPKSPYELTALSIYYNQDIIDNVAASLKKEKHQIPVEEGHIIVKMVDIFGNDTMKVIGVTV